MITIQQIVSLVTGLAEKARNLAEDKVTIAQKLADASDQLLVATERIKELGEIIELRDLEILRLNDEDKIEDSEAAEKASIAAETIEQLISQLTDQANATAAAAIEAEALKEAAEAELVQAVSDANELLAA